MKAILFLIAFHFLLAQPSRFPFRAVSGGGGGGTAPAWITDFHYRNPREAPPNLSVGQGWTNGYGNCIIRLTSNGGNDYVYPTAVNPQKTWVMYVAAGGGRRLLRLPTPTGCSMPDIGSPITISYPADVLGESGIPLMHWSNTEANVLYLAGGGGPGSNNGIWELRCTANCTLDTATWTWSQIKSLNGSDGSGAFINWDNAAFCLSGTGPSCTRVGDFNGINPYLYAVSSDDDYFQFSFRGGTKSEYGMCAWRRSTDNLSCYYLGNNGTMPGTETPAAGAGHKGHGVAAVYQQVSTGYVAYQVGGGGAPTRIYRKPLPTARQGTWDNAESLTGSITPNHGALESTNIMTLADVLAANGTCAGNNNWITSYLRFPLAGTITTPGAGTAYTRAFDLEWCSWGGGAHINSNALTPKYHVGTFYTESTAAAFGSCETVAGIRGGCGELVAVDVTTQNSIIRLGQTFSWCNNGSSCNDAYDAQGHANRTGNYVVFKSNWQNVAGGARDHTQPISMYLMIVGTHVNFD